MITEHRPFEANWCRSRAALAMLLPQEGGCKPIPSAPPAMRWPAPSTPRRCSRMHRAAVREELHRGDDFRVIPSRDRTGMTFVNRSDKADQALLLDFRAMRTLYRFPASGRQGFSSDFHRAQLVVSTLADQCIGIFNAAPESIAFF